MPGRGHQYGGVEAVALMGLLRQRHEEVGGGKCRVEVHTRSIDSGVQWKDQVKEGGRQRRWKSLGRCFFSPSLWRALAAGC